MKLKYYGNLKSKERMDENLAREMYEKRLQSAVKRNLVDSAVNVIENPEILRNLHLLMFGNRI